MNGEIANHMGLGLPGLLPDAARRYLAHTTQGRPIREIAREAGCHASTVMRHVRKLETLRDDPLVDSALARIEASDTDLLESETGLEMAADTLRALCGRGAMLLFSADLPQPAIVQPGQDGMAEVVHRVQLELAAALVLRGWVAGTGGGALKKYRVTDEGRAVLPALVAARDRRATGRLEDMREAYSTKSADRRSRNRAATNGPGSESPLAALARRRGQDGKPFLNADFTAAGERLHADYVLSGLPPQDLLGWETPASLDPLFERTKREANKGRASAMRRTLRAMADLGPGLSDVALRCCCLREGLEITEKRMGWSARSGKVVLRIALQRLSLHYSFCAPEEGVLIG